MRLIPSAMLLALTGAMVGGCGSDSRPNRAIGLEAADAPVTLAQGLSPPPGLSLPPGHPPLYDGSATLPEGHPPLVDGGAALPEGHPRCPRGVQMPQEAPELDYSPRSGAEELVST